MNTALWIVQAILGIKLLTAAFSHGLQQDRPEMRQAMDKMGKAARPVHWLASLLLLFVTAGLVLPGLSGWPFWFTPGAALAAAMLLLLSVVLHVRTRERPKVFVSLVLLAFALFAAYGRWFLSPFGN